MAEGPAHENWSSRTAFLLAAIGGAVGLGNIWKFPYMVGENGGGAFVLIYLLAVCAVVIPVLAAELMIGRRGHRSPVGAMRRLAGEFGVSRAWVGLGWLGMTVAFLVLSFFGAVATWALAYIPKAASGALTGITPQAANRMFTDMLSNPVQLMAWNAGYLGVTVWIIARGIHAGIEKTVKGLMPALFVSLLILVIYALIAGDAARGINFMLAPNFSALDGQVVLKAVGQAFLSVGIASGVMMTYGAYLPRGISIVRAAAVIALVDAGVALMAGLAIFPVVFAAGFDPAEGPGLAFVIFPYALGGMPGGQILGTLFFVLLVIATLTSSIAVLEPIVSWAEEHRGVRRVYSAMAAGVAAWMLGLGTLFSFSLWKNVYPLGFLPWFEKQTVFVLADHLITAVLLPLGGFLIAVFAGWRMTRKAVMEELGWGDDWRFRTWRALIRYVAPAGVAAVFIYGLI